MGSSFAAVFLASVLGSGHCVGMCGGLAAFCGGASKEDTAASSFFSSAAYNLGRFFSYVVLGAIAGFVGKSVNVLGSTAGVQQSAFLAAGILLLIAGITGFLGKKPSQYILGKAKANTLILRVLSSPRVKSLGPTQRAASLGLLSAALPCGWLWAFVVVAAGGGSTLLGAGVMAAFWLGTVPALALVGGLSHVFKTRLQRVSPQLSAAFLIIAGLAFLFQHGGNLGQNLTPRSASAAIEEAPAPHCH